MSYIIRRFLPDTDVSKPFDCGNSDLNDFWVESSAKTPNASLFQKEHLSVTYLVEDVQSGVVMAYFSLLNDKIERAVSDPKVWNKLSRHIPNPKRRSSYPALKVGRLAVSNAAQRSGLGKMILTFLQIWYFKNTPSGCRYLTVDALRESVDFYQKCHFSPLVDPDPDDDTVLMFFDLMELD